MHHLLASRFARRFSLDVPVALAPMALASGGALAAACSRAGALGLVGGGYADPAWTQREYALALREGVRDRIGCGFITWSLAPDASALDWVLDQGPRAVMLSFGDPRPYAARIAASNAALMCQVQRLEDVPLAVEAGAQVIVAQGAEAGGHGMSGMEARATFTLVPEIADWLAAHANDVLLLAAGGVADGRGLAAALALGADGALVGTRLWASDECLASAAAKQVALRTSGDDTGRSAIFDILRRRNWPPIFGLRSVRNELHRKWEDRVEELRRAPDDVRTEYEAAVANGDFTRAHVIVGESAGLVHDVAPAGEIIARMWRDARAILGS